MEYFESGELKNKSRGRRSCTASVSNNIQTLDERMVTLALDPRSRKRSLDEGEASDIMIDLSDNPKFKRFHSDEELEEYDNLLNVKRDPKEGENLLKTNAGKAMKKNIAEREIYYDVYEEEDLYVRELFVEVNSESRIESLEIPIAQGIYEEDDLYLRELFMEDGIDYYSMNKMVDDGMKNKLYKIFVAGACNSGINTTK